MAIIIAILIVALLVKNAFLGTNGAAFIGDVILVVIIAAVLSSC